MKLYERLEYMNASPADLAGNFAEYVRHDPAANRAEIGRELSAILERRAQLAADLERIAEEMGEKRKAWQDFADIPGTPQPNKGAQLANIEAEKAAQAEAENTRVEVEAVISALDLLFCEICRALDFEGLSITSGEISALKRYTIPQRLAVELDTIKRGKIATIPQAERLNVEDAAALYESLTRAGLISGPLGAYCTGQRYGTGTAGTVGRFLLSRLSHPSGAYSGISGGDPPVCGKGFPPGGRTGAVYSWLAGLFLQGIRLSAGCLPGVWHGGEYALHG